MTSHRSTTSNNSPLPDPAQPEITPAPKTSRTISAVSPAGPAPCPACRQDGFSPVFEKMGLTYHRCSGCGLLRAWPIPAEGRDRYRQRGYYEALGVTGADPSLDRMKETIGAARRRRLVTLAARGPLLEIGCGGGYFLESARDLLPIGLDISMEALAGIPRGRLLIGDPTQLPLAPGFAGTVACYDTIEHLQDPDKAMHQISAALSPGGLLHLTTPRADGLPARLLGRHFPHANPEHLVLFTKQAMETLLSRHGFESIRFRSVRKPLTLGYLASRLARYRIPLVSPLLRALLAIVPPLARISFSMPTGEMEVTARKPRLRAEAVQGAVSP